MLQCRLLLFPTKFHFWSTNLIDDAKGWSKDGDAGTSIFSSSPQRLQLIRRSWTNNSPKLSALHSHFWDHFPCSFVFNCIKVRHAPGGTHRQKASNFELLYLPRFEYACWRVCPQITNKGHEYESRKKKLSYRALLLKTAFTSRLHPSYPFPIPTSIIKSSFFYDEIPGPISELPHCRFFHPHAPHSEIYPWVSMHWYLFQPHVYVCSAPCSCFPCQIYKSNRYIS